MAQEILVLQGPPACGKSTFARQFAHEHHEYVIVSRDAFREGRGDYWIPEQEKYISALENFAISEALDRGLSVIIDATNLNPKVITKWTSLADNHGVDISFKNFYIPMEEAIARDQNADRAHKVGRGVIEDFYGRYYNEGPKAEEK